MAKARGPLHSIGAHGQIGKAMIHQSWKGIPRVKKYRKPTQPNSAAQLDKRNLIRTGVQRWQGLSDRFKSLWQTAIKNVGKTMSGYNFFLSQYLNDIVAGKTPFDWPPWHLIPRYPIIDGLVGWWRLDERTGSIAYDSIGTNHGTIHGTTWVPGKINSALQFNGISDYIDLGNSPILNPNFMSISAWVSLPTLNGSVRSILGRYKITAGYYFAVAANNKFTWQLQPGAHYIWANDVITPNLWYHVAATYDGAIQKLYVNGEVQSDVEIWGGAIGSNDIITTIGSVSGTGWFKGIIDEVLIYNRALSPTEINYLSLIGK